MPKYLTPTDFQKLVSKKEYSSEEELEREVMEKLPALLKIKPSQIQNQVTTTSFDKTLSNCCDIVVSSDEEIPHVIYIIEIKRDKMIEKYHQGDYINAVKQLHKYCQDVRSPYGILLTETVCIFYKHRYYKQDYKPEKTQKILYPMRAEEKITQRSLIEFIYHKSSLKYVYIFLIILALYFFISTRSLGYFLVKH